MTPAARTKVAIVGAGIIGSSLACELTRRGADVTVFDTGQPGNGTSRTSLAWLNANKKQPRAYFDLSVEAMGLWRDHARTLDNASWYRPTGNLAWADTEPTRAELAERVTRLRSWGYRADLLDTRQAQQIEPALTIPGDAVIAHFPDEGHILGDTAARALLDRAVTAGAALHTGTEITSLMPAAGTSAGVVTGDGQQRGFDTVIVAAGWRSRPLLAQHGITLPLFDGAELGSTAPCLVVTLTGTPHPMHGVFHGPGLYGRSGASETELVLEASDIDRAVDLQTPQAELDRHARTIYERAQRIVSGAQKARIAHAETCVRPMPTDGYPIVGRIPGIERVYVAVMHSGITLAPIIARLAANEIIHGIPEDVLTAYRPDRAA